MTGFLNLLKFTHFSNADSLRLNMTNKDTPTQRRPSAMSDSVLIRVLQNRTFTATDQLFSVSDFDIINELVGFF